MYLLAIRYSAAAIKSSKTVCFFPSIPARCQSSPNSPPPRRFASARIPPCSAQTSASGQQYGVSLTSNPPSRSAKWDSNLPPSNPSCGTKTWAQAFCPWTGTKPVESRRRRDQMASCLWPTVRISLASRRTGIWMVRSYRTRRKQRVQGFPNVPWKLRPSRAPVER